MPWGSGGGGGGWDSATQTSWEAMSPSWERFARDWEARGTDAFKDLELQKAAWRGDKVEKTSPMKMLWQKLLGGKEKKKKDSLVSYERNQTKKMNAEDWAMALQEMMSIGQEKRPLNPYISQGLAGLPRLDEIGQVRY
ncbi:MAG: hypothetical protein GY853_13390 [PVC group bacterium]|nr:hypothetical protein [PVC group bacterium]